MRSKQGYNSSEYRWWRIGVVVHKHGGVLVNRFGGVSVHRLSLWCIGSECAMPSRPSSALLSQGSLPLIRLSDTCTNAHQHRYCTSILLYCFPANQAICKLNQWSHNTKLLLPTLYIVHVQMHTSVPVYQYTTNQPI